MTVLSVHVFAVLCLRSCHTGNVTLLLENPTSGHSLECSHCNMINEWNQAVVPVYVLGDIWDGWIIIDCEGIEYEQSLRVKIYFMKGSL